MTEVVHMDYGKVQQKINDVVGDNVKKLAQLFPSAVKDGEVDFEVVHTEGVYKKDTSWCKKGEKWEDDSVQVIGKGNINFVGKQTGL